MDAEMDNVKQKKRGRKKLLYQSILKQMEFYFSPANLAKDRWLSNKLHEDGNILLTEFLKFNKIKALTNDVNHLAKALEKSEILSVTEDLKVSRTQPVKFKENEEEYIIYVEQVPPDADHDWISGFFSAYGKIDYISLPKFKNTNKCKGFAFIEFADIESAQKAIKDFQEKGNYLSTDIAPAELLSIASYEGNNSSVQKEKETSDVDVLSSNELEISSDVSSSAKNGTKKRKISEESETSQEPKKVKKNSSNEDVINTLSKDHTVIEESAGSERDDGNTDETKKKKNRKKKKKKNKNKEVIENSGLQILSKKDWRRLRNKYLNMQKEKMKQLKKHLYTAQKKSDSAKQNGVQRKKNEPECKGIKPEKEQTSKHPIPFTTGLIVKIDVDEPVIDVKGFKNEMKKYSSIKYVDVKEGVQKVYLRFESPESASEFCEQSTWAKTKVLKGQKEEDYWEKLQKQREEKLQSQTKKKERGKDKLKKKAENILGKHITFEDV